MPLVCDSFVLPNYDNRVLKAAVATHSLLGVGRYVSIEAIVIAMSVPHAGHMAGIRSQVSTMNFGSVEDTAEYYP